MASVMKEFEHLKIHLEEIKKATNSFSGKVIGTGGFGKVYEGEVSHSRGRSIVAIKRLDRQFGQGDPEFLKEIVMLSRYAHMNLISLLGFCDEDGEKILVYEHASNGSLDRHLSSTVLTWTKRLNICLDVARGLAYLHDHKGTQQRVLHRDIKSGNILLDDNWNAKLADMGLSKIGPANQLHTALFTNVVGTPGYCDPQYMVTYALTKESDIYSFGVVLFEVLCGRLCFKWTNNHLDVLVPMWKHIYLQKKLDQIIFKDLIPSMDPTSLTTFSDIAFQCLHDSREQRPTASLLVSKLEIALKFQGRHDMKLTNDVGTSLKYTYGDELGVVLSKGKGFFLNMGITERGERKLVHFDDTLMGLTVDDLLSGFPEVMWKSTYGTHYKVTLTNGDRVSITRLGENFADKKQRKALVEVMNVVGYIKHPNLLPMRAYIYTRKKDTSIVYDYIPNGSLATFLHARGAKTRVNWPTRMRIAKGVARGLLGLHAHQTVIHGNLKSSNVWLTEDINPMISDFGLSFSNMTAPDRFPGYQAPEFLSKTKIDVYSLGIILLELITGKSPEDPINGLDLPQWVPLIVNEEWAPYEVFDQELMKDASAAGEDELLNSLKLALQCVNESPYHRPDAQMVLQQLEEIRPETGRYKFRQ